MGSGVLANEEEVRRELIAIKYYCPQLRRKLYTTQRKRGEVDSGTESAVQCGGLWQ